MPPHSVPSFSGLLQQGSGQQQPDTEVPRADLAHTVALQPAIIPDLMLPVKQQPQRQLHARNARRSHRRPLPGAAFHLPASPNDSCAQRPGQGHCRVGTPPPEQFQARIPCRAHPRIESHGPILRRPSRLMPGSFCQLPGMHPRPRGYNRPGRNAQ